MARHAQSTGVQLKPILNAGAITGILVASCSSLRVTKIATLLGFKLNGFDIFTRFPRRHNIYRTRPSKNRLKLRQIDSHGTNLAPGVELQPVASTALGFPLNYWKCLVLTCANICWLSHLAICASYHITIKYFRYHIYIYYHSCKSVRGVLYNWPLPILPTISPSISDLRRKLWQPPLEIGDRFVVATSVRSIVLLVRSVVFVPPKRIAKLSRHEISWDPTHVGYCLFLWQLFMQNI